MITLATLPEATAQEVFDQVAKHLLTQRKQSMDENNRCVYRGPNGLQCAAGCLMTDEEHAAIPRIVRGKVWSCLVEKNIAPEIHADLISDCQNIHDHSEPRYWKHELKELAKNQHLEWRFGK